jgi:hypothetical protein
MSSVNKIYNPSYGFKTSTTWGCYEGLSAHPKLKYWAPYMLKCFLIYVAVNDTKKKKKNYIDSFFKILLCIVLELLFLLYLNN